MDGDEGSGPHSSSLELRPTKRLKTNTSNAQSGSKKPGKATRKRTSKLANLPGMPIDILFEIFGHLHPYDLLKLSRMTKDFRRLLTSKSAITVWKESLLNVPGLPECPPDMCEIAWANLAFSPHCHFCFCTGIRSIEWRFRVRMCSKCAKDRLIDVPYFLPEYDMFDEKFPLSIPGFFIQKIDKRREVCLVSDVDKFLEDFKSISDNAAWQDYVSDRKTSTELILKHAIHCEAWERDQAYDRESELRQLRKDRIAAIKEKLIGMGWEKDLASMSYDNTLSTNKLANRPQRLTDRVWSNIKSGILEHMEKVRARRLKGEYDKLVSDRRLLSLQVLRDYKRLNLAENLVLPKPADFYEFPPVKEITELPVDIEVTLSSFDTVIPKLPELVNNWREQLERKLVEIAKGPKVSGLFDEDILTRSRKTDSPFAGLSEEELLQKVKLASTVYECTKCKFNNNYYDDDDDDDDFDGAFDFKREGPRSKPLFYPHVLGHQCNQINTWYWHLDDPILVNEEPLIKNIKHLRVTSSKFAENVIELAGLDPATATADDMDKLDLRFVCKICSESLTETLSWIDDGTIDKEEDCLRYLFDWRTAVRHEKDVHGFSQDQVYIKLRTDELDNEVLLEESECRLQNNREWRCIHCIDFGYQNPPMTFDSIKAHFKLKHRELPPPVINESCFRDFAAPNIHCIQSPFTIHSKNGRYSVYTEHSDGSNSEEDTDSGAVDMY